MSKYTGKLCSCGFPQSCPIPHEHDQTVREQTIVKHFEGRIRDLLKQREDLLAACEDALKKLTWPIYTDKEIQAMKPCREKLKVAIENAKVEQ